MTGASESPGSPPVLLTSLAAAVLADGAGDVRYSREARGAATEWGGVYGQLARLTGPWTLRLARNGRTSDLPSTRVASGSFPGGWSSRHRWAGLDLVQDLAATDHPAGAVRRLVLSSSEASLTAVTVSSAFSPYLFPVLVEGIRPTAFELHTEGPVLMARHGGIGLRLRSSGAPVRFRLNGSPWNGRTYHGPVTQVESDHEVVVPAGGTTEIRWQIIGGLDGDLEAARTSEEPFLPAPSDVAARLSVEEDRWARSTPELEFPDAPDLELAYAQARAALRRLYTSPGDGMTGLVAGYPWYSAIWCRDLAVMLPALVWLGDFDWARRSLATVFRFQSRGKIPFLAGEPGELPMQVAPGPVFLYGTSDSTLRFPPVVEQVYRHVGDAGEVAAWADALHRIVLWGERRCDPGTGLLTHGGEAEMISAATATLGQVHYGIDAPDTTIWDSADRRDHAVDVQVLWWQTLRAAASLLGRADDAVRQASCEGLAGRLRETLATRYIWPEEGYLYDSIRTGAPVARLRPNALRAVSAGLVDPTFARRMVERAARDDLTTPWGVRCLSARDPAFDPRAYHEGQVWTIATAWAADAAYAVGDRARGLEYLRTIAGRYVREGGWANECYRGDRDEPFDSCYLLGFSVAPFLTLLFERLWGLRVLEPGTGLRVAPAFPDGWSSARLHRLRLGSGWVDLDWSPARLVVAWTGAGPLSVEAGNGVATVLPGSSVTVALADSAQRS